MASTDRSLALFGVVAGIAEKAEAVPVEQAAALKIAAEVVAVVRQAGTVEHSLASGAGQVGVVAKVGLVIAYSDP